MCSKLSLIILDACRENPFLRGSDAPTLTRGIASHPLAEQPTAANTLIAYAAKAGSLSYDGAGANSPFTTALVKHIAEPGLDIRIALGRVRDDVLRATGHRQEPFVYGSLGGETVSLTPAAATRSDPLAATAADYALAERVGSADAWRAFISAHREGGFMSISPAPSLNRTAPSPAPRRSPSQSRRRARCRQTEAGAAAPTTAPLQGGKRAAGGSAQRPSPDAIAAFAAGMTCTALRPQLTRLMESVGLASPPTPPAPTRLAARNPEPAGCDAEGRELERLRAEPELARAKALFDRLTCAALRPQVQRMMESLGVEPPPVAAPLAVAPAPAVETAAARAQAGRLRALRARPTGPPCAPSPPGCAAMR